MLQKFVKRLAILYNKMDNTLKTLLGPCINIGCGQDIRLGWINCDRVTMSASVKQFDATNQVDLEWLTTIKSNTIECSHFIGYLNYAQAKNFFSACHASLQESGALILEFPDIVKISKQLVEHDQLGRDISSYIELIRAIYAFDQADAFNTEFSQQTYIFGWSGNFLQTILSEVGFKKILIQMPRGHGRMAWRDTRVIAQK